MGIFATSSPFDQYVERATSEKNTGEDWALIMDVCDRVKDSGSGPKECLKSISKRLNHDNPRVVLQTIILLDACINNCGRKFLLEVAGRDFEQEISKQVTSTRTHPKVASRMRECLKSWAEGEFKGDPELGLIPALYNKLVKDGYDFDAESEMPKKTVSYSNDPNVVNNKQEEDDIAKAIQLSLQESSSNKLGQTAQVNPTTSLYGVASAALSSKESPVPEKEPLKVRAIYDFEAAEDNELTFKAGEIILVIDHSDPNWWKGTNHRGEGLFPANFVTKTLEDDEPPKNEGTNKRVSFSECVEVTEVSEDSTLDLHEGSSGEINESKIDQLIHFLHEADPTGERGDDPSLPMLEDEVNSMAPSIDAELERIDRKHAQLTMLSKDLVEALNLYHQLMRDMPPSMPYYSPFNQGPTNLPGGPSMHPGMMPPNQFMSSNPQHMATAVSASQYGSYPMNYPGGPMPPYMTPPTMASTASPNAAVSYPQSTSMSSTLPSYSHLPPPGHAPPEFGSLSHDPSAAGGLQHGTTVGMPTSMMPPGSSHFQGMPHQVPSVAVANSSSVMPPVSQINMHPQVSQNIGGPIPTMSSQGPQNIAGPPPVMSSQGPPNVQGQGGPHQPMAMMSQGQPISTVAHPMNFYTQPTFQNMQQQQPLL